MALVAKINGVPIYSDKEVKAVANTRVTFRDGSWCDTRTGEVYNTGSGFVTIGGGGNDSQTKVTEGPKRVSASALELRKMAANIEVDAYNDNGIEYTISGPRELVKAIRANVQNGTLVIEGDGAESASYGTSITSSGDIVIGSISVSNFRGGNSVVIGGGDESDVKITVKVPRSTAVTSTGVRGEVTIGNTDGSLTAHAKNSSSVTAGHVASVDLKASSNAKIYVKQVSGNVIASAKNSGVIDIEAGSVPVLDATASNSGAIHIGGIVERADQLDASNSGSIRVTQVRQQPNPKQRNSGRVHIGTIG